MPRAESCWATGMALVLLGSGCTPRRHAWRLDPTVAADLERRAVETCAAQRVPVPPAPFTTDGCSAWWDDGWVNCCVTHDMAYWCGGPGAARAAADRELARCVRRTGARVGPLMQCGVRAGGMGWLPLPWRWGYGWPWLGAP